MKGEFYKMDFRAWNMGTVDLTLEQEAAYLRLCHAMYDVGGPVPNTSRFLMSIFRCGNVKANALVQHLIEAGKIAVTRDGKLFNHRVSEELADRERVSAARRIAGEKGGSAARQKGECRSSDGRVNAEWCPSDPRVTPEWCPSEGRVAASKPLKSNDLFEANASTPGSREEKRREDTPKAPKGADEPEGFLEFKAAYPKRNTAFPTTPARKRWLEARKRGAKPEDIIAGAKGYAAEQARIGKVGTEFVQTADVWLNKQRWHDYLDAASSAGPGGAPGSDPLANVSPDRWRTEVRNWKKTGGHWPFQRLGCPAPDNPNTKVPRAILVEFGLASRSAIAA